MEKESAKVFISYSRGDYKDALGNELPNNVITKIKDALNAENISYWIDESLAVGDDWAQKIPPAIAECDIFVFVSSKNSNDSYFTKSEVAIAHEYDKHIIPFRIDGTRYNPSIVVYLAGLQHISYYINQENGLKKLVVAVKTYLDELKNKEEVKKQEIEDQKKITEIDRELKAQYDKKLLLENNINEQKSSLSEMELQMDAILQAIKDLEENKDNLNGKSEKVSLIDNINSLSGGVGTLPELKAKSISKAYKKSNKKIKRQWVVMLCLVVVALCILLIRVTSLSSDNNNLQTQTDNYKQRIDAIKERVDSLPSIIFDMTVSWEDCDDEYSGEFKAYAKEGDTLYISRNFPKDSYEKFLHVYIDERLVYNSQDYLPDRVYVFKYSQTHKFRYCYKQYYKNYHYTNRSKKLRLYIRSNIKNILTEEIGE